MRTMTGEISPISREMIEAFLTKNEYNYLVDRDGDIVLQYRYDEELDTELTAYFYIEGDNKTIYYIQVLNRRRIHKPDWDHYVWLCNRFNQAFRWPKVYLSLPRTETSETATIVLEYYIPAAAGIHQELFDEITDAILGGSFRFWRWLKEQLDAEAAQG